MATRKEIAQNQKILYDDAVANNMFQAAVPTFKEFQKRLEGQGYQKMVYDNYKKHNVKGKGFNNLNEFRGAFGGSFYADENKVGLSNRAQAISASAQQTVNNAGRYNRLKQRKQKQQKNFGRVNLGTNKTPYGGDANNVVKDDFAYNPETGKAGVYVTSDNENAYTQNDAEQKQAILDQQNNAYQEAVDTGEIPSAFDVRDKNGNYDLQENIGKNGTYVTKVGLANQLNARLNAAYSERDRLNELARKRMEEIDSRKGQGFTDFMMRSNAASSAGGGLAGISEAETRKYEMDDTYRNIMTALRQNKATITTLEDVKNDQMNGFWHTLGTTMANGYTLTDGMGIFNDVISMQQAKKHLDEINKKRKSGNQLTPKEQLLESVLSNTAINNVVQNQYGGDYGAWARAGMTSARSIDFMKEIATFPFAGSIAKSTASRVAKIGAEQLAKKAGEGLVKSTSKWLARNFLKATGILTGSHVAGAAISNTTGIGSTMGLMGQLYIGNVGYNQKGNYEFNDVMKLLPSFLEAERGQIGENGSEMFGEFLPGGKAFVNGIEKIGLSKIAGYLNNIANKQWVKEYYSVLKQGGYNGIIGEGAEEYEGMFYDALTGRADETWKNLKDLKTHVDIWLGVGSMSVLLGAVPVALNGNQTYSYFKYKHKVNVADKLAEKSFGDQNKWEELKNQIDETPNEQMAGVIVNLIRSRDTYSKEQINCAIDYARNLTKQRVYNIVEMVNANESSDIDPTGDNKQKNQEIGDAYAEGHNADDADKHNIQLEQNDKANELAAMLHITPEQLHDMADEDLETMTGQDDKLDQAIYDYQVSTAKYQGVMDGAQDEVDMAAHQAAMETDNMTDLSRGTVRKATIKATGGLEDYEVYIISGNIATHDDGSIDVGNSDDMIIYYDPTTGRKEHADAMMFADLIEELPAADVKAQAINDAKENTIKKIAGIIDGTVEVGSQFSVTDADGTEHTYEVLADNGDGTAMITIDGNVPTELVKGENVQIPYSFADLQQMKDMEDQKRLEAAKAEREQMEKERTEQQNQETEQTQPSFDFNQILNDNGNVVLVDVLDKDGNTKYPDSRLFLIRDAGAKAKVVELKSDGTLVPHAVNKEDVATISSMSLDEYKQAMPESSMIEDNSGEESDEDSLLANLGLPKGSEIWMSGDGFGRPKENTLSRVVGIDEQGSIILEDKDGKKWSASFDYINNHRELPPLDENTNIVNDENNQSESNAEENTPAPEQTPAITLEDGTIVPMLEDGNPDFSKLTAAQTAELYDTQFGEDADSIVSGYVSDAKKALDKASNMTVKGKTFVEQKAAKDAKEKAIADAQAAYDSAIAIRDAYNERQLAKVEDTAEGRKELIEKARRKFARLKSAVKDDAEAVSQLYRETIGSLLHRLYDSTGIDVTDTTPLTAEEYVASNLGAHSLNYEGTETSKGVKQETGLSREDFAKTQLLAADGKGTTIDALVHSLWENRPSNLESLDTQDIRNALIGVLNSGFKASEARNFVENIRIAQAENILEEQKRAQENAAYAEQHKAEPEAELKAKSDEKAELKAKSEAKLDNESSNESNDLDNDLDNEKTNDKINDNINVPEDATDENPLGAERDESDLPFSAKENGKQQTTAERAADVEKNKVDDMKVVDNIVGQKTRKAFERLAKMMGATIQWQYSDKLGNGWIQETTDADGNVLRTIFVTLDSSIKEGAQFIFGHEMTHQIKKLNPAAYNELTQLVLDTYGSDAFDKAVDETMQRYSDVGFSGRARDYYAEEVVADAVGEMIRDLNLAHTLAMKMSHPLLAAIHEILQKIKLAFFGTEYNDVTKNIIRSIEQAYVKTANGQVTNSETGEDVSFSLRQKPEPKKKGVGYKVFVLKDGKLYPPMVANPDGAATPVGVWLDADAAPIAGESKTGRPQVKQGGKGTQGGSGKLAYRPGWHLGVVPYAIQFNRKDAEGNKTLFPKNFVFAEVEYAADVDYQEEARQEGINPSGKYQHSLAGLKHLPTDGYYMYRTNPNPETDPWVITGAMKVNRILTRAEQAELVKNAGREPQQIQEGDIVTDDVVNSINQEIADAPKFSLKTYHGTGANFDRFDTSHAYEGAGSETFGHGIYVTKSAKIGASYALNAKVKKIKTPKAFKAIKNGDNWFGRFIDNAVRSSFAKAKKETFNRMDELIKEDENIVNDETKPEWKKNAAQKELADFDKLKSLFEGLTEEDIPSLKRAKANRYEVEIPDDTGNNYLDWNKPMKKEQKKIVREGLEKLGVDVDRLVRNGYSLDKNFGDVYNGLLYYALNGTKFEERDSFVASSNFLSSLGFTGIKYYAGTIWGGAKKGDLNYVIFNEDDAKIVGNTKFSLKSKPVRFEAGKKLSDEEKKEVLSTLKDAYKVNGVPYHIEETAGGKEKRVYEPTADSYVVSDITNRPLRYYITLPDGRVAHPTEVYPNISDNEVKSSATKQGLLDEEVDQIVSAAIGNMKDIADNAKAVEILNELQNLPHETHDVGYGLNHVRSYNYKTGIFTSDAAQAIDYVVRRMRRKEDVPAEIPAALKKAVANSYGMVDNLIDGMSSIKFSLKDNQGNPLNQDGTLKLDKIKSVDELTDEDFLHPTRNVELPSLPKKIADAIGTEGKPVVIKKNIFERNYMRHKDVTPELSKVIFKSALYNPDLYGQNQKKTRPYNWVLINTKDEKGNNRTVLLEVNPNKDNVEIVHWHFIDERGLKKIKKQADREDGQLLILPSNKEEVGALSDPTVNLTAAKIDNSSETAKENGEKFSLKDEKTMFGMHNISLDKLRKAIKQGGFAAPSMGVIDSKNGIYSGYGEITLIPKAEKIAKRTGKNIGTYAADAWTPIYPPVEKKFGGNGGDVAYDDIESVPKEMQRLTRNAINSFMDGREANGLAYLYLQEKGKAPELVHVEGKYPKELHDEVKGILGKLNGIYNTTDEQKEKLLDLFIREVYDGNKEEFDNDIKKFIKKDEELIKKRPNSNIAKNKQLDVDWMKEHGYDYGALSRFVDGILRDAETSGKVDENATMKAAQQYIQDKGMKEDFDSWKEKLNDRYNVEEVIFAGYKPDGNRKYLPNTVENAVKVMKHDGKNASVGLASFSHFVASILKPMGTLDQIRKKKGNLTGNYEDVEKFQEKWQPVYDELADKMQPDAEPFESYGMDRLEEVATQKNPKKYAKEEYGVDLTDDDINKLNELIEAVKNDKPSIYFETKFMRPYGLDEFEKAIVPNDTPSDVVDALKMAGIDVSSYERGNAEDRQKVTMDAINSSDNIRFSLKSMMAKPEGWKQANKKAIHIAEAIERDPKFSLKNLDGTLIKAGTYFSGGGLVEEGLKGIIDPVLAVEYDEKISGVYRNNFGQHIVTADVRDVDPKELVKQIDGEVEYFHASPVCKNYSQAKSNHAEVELDKETAASTAEFINAIKPKVVTIENVKGYKDSDAMKTITDALDANGYTWDADVYNAADYGGYTNRERLIVRAVRDGKLPDKPKKMAHKSGWYEAVADIIPTLTEKKNGVAPWMDIRLKADGIDWRNIDKPLYVMGSAYADGKIPHAFADELLPTLRTKSGDVIVMPDGKVYRAMGRVLARVSGVSDDYKMPFSENLSHTIIGNGIPTQLTEHVIAPLLTGSDPKFSIRTYHGTGAKFDKFDLSHAFDGEGSETFGHGVYVTNSKKIGDNYAQRAKDRKGKFGFDYKIDMSADAGQMLSHYINKNQDVDKGLENARQDLKSALEMFPDAETLKELSAILQKNNNEIAEVSNEAYLYDVDIPDDNGENYLEWNESQNFPLEKWYRLWEITHHGFNENEYFKDGGANYDKDRIERIIQMKLDSSENGMQKLPTLKGEELYHALEDFFDRERPLRGAKLASRALSEIGFVGIKYPAGMIHGGAEEGDYNYVIFDEDNANIVGNTKFSLRYDKFEHDLNQWKKDNNLPKDAQRPTIPQRNAGESAVDFLKRVDEYRKQMALWKTAPTYEQHLLSDDTALGEFNRELQRGSVLKRIAFQDSMLAIRKAQEAIMKEVGVDRLNMAEDAYTAENRSHGKGKNEFEEYNNEFLQPLRKAYHQMKKILGDSYDNVRIYMMAKHGLERDAQMAFKKSLEADYEDVAQRSAAYKAYKGDMNRIINDSDLEFGRVDFTTWRQRDNALRAKYSPSYMDYRYDKNGIAYDYSGLSALFDGSDFEEAAYKLVKDIEDKYVTETHNLWDATNAATKKILRDGYKAGMMSKDTYQYVRDMYSHYIPLRGWDGTTADQVWDYIGGGKGAFNQTLKTAHGRTSIADDPIAYIENMAESGILLNNKNWVKQHLMLLAQNHPTSLLTLSKAWYVKSMDANGNEEWVPATPQITSQMNSNQVKAAIDAFEKKMEQMAQTGDATQKRDGLNIAYPQTHSEEREHEVRVMKDGEEYVIYVNGDPQLAQAMNNTRAHRVREIQSGKLDRAAAWLGRKMAAAYTSLSPLFIPSNYFRDLTMTLASTAIREDAKYNYLLRKNLATSWNLGFMLRDYQNGKLRDNVSNGNATPKEQMFYDFMMNGGETGFVSSLDVEDLKKKFKNDLKDLDRWKANPVKVGHTIMDSIEFLNRMIEDSNRFAIYMTSIQYGRSIDEAVNDAKDVTLNFNRKGTGEYGWQMIRNLYLFINPAVQSLQTLGALAKHHPFKFTAVTASWLASGVLVPIVNAALMSLLGGDDDKDKYWQFTKWDRRNNLIMWVPFTHEYIKIPLAQEFRAFYGIGDMIASKMMGGELAEESWSQYAEDLLGQVVDMLPLDPTGYDGNIAVSLMPNAIRPVFELAFNVDFTGKPLFKETEYNKYDPNFTKAYVGTPDWLVRASRMVNSIGNDYPDVQQNSIDAFGDPRYNLNNPAVVDHVLSSYLGGAYTMGSQILGVLTKSLNDRKEIKVADIPLFSKFVSNPDDRPVTKKQGDEFWNMKENHDRAANTLSKLKKQAKDDGDYSMLERFYGSDEYKQYKQDDVKVKKYEEDKKKERAEESGEEYRPHKLNAEDIYKAHATPKDDFEDLKLKQLYTKLNGFKTSYDLLVDTAPSQSDAYYNTNKAAIDAIDEISLDKHEISELKKGFLDDGKDAYNAEDMKQIRDLRKKILAVLEKANKVVVANQKAKADK